LTIGLLGAPLGAHAERQLSLQDAVTLARTSRSEAAQAEIDLERAQLGVLRAKLERVKLTIVGQGSVQAQDLNVQITGDTTGASMVCMFSPLLCDTEAHRYGGTADLVIPIWSGFAVEADLSRARWTERAAQAQKRVTARTVGLDAARAYWAVRRVELLRDVEAEAVRRDQEIEQIVRARVVSGVAPQVDLNRALVSTLREQSNLASLAGQVSEARAQLAAALQVDDEVALTEDPSAHAQLLLPLGDAVATARSERPELVASQAQVMAQGEAVRAAKGPYWPQLSLFAHADIANANVVFTTLPQEELFANFAAGAQVTWTLFDTLTTWAIVKDARFQLHRLQQDRVRAGVLVDADVKGAYARVTRTLAQKSPLEQAVAVARDNLEIIRRRYEAGDALVIELLDAQVQLLQAESSRIDNAVALAQADAELQAALGRL
jgi:outer membrane protein TolC